MIEKIVDYDDIPDEMYKYICNMCRQGVYDIRAVYRIARIRYADKHGISPFDLPDISETELGRSLSMPRNIGGKDTENVE